MPLDLFHEQSDAFFQPFAEIKIHRSFKHPTGNIFTSDIISKKNDNV